jgi:hypothetical protein
MYSYGIAASCFDWAGRWYLYISVSLFEGIFLPKANPMTALSEAVTKVSTVFSNDQLSVPLVLSAAYTAAITTIPNKTSNPIPMNNVNNNFPIVTIISKLDFVNTGRC